MMKRLLALLLAACLCLSTLPVFAEEAEDTDIPLPTEEEEAPTDEEMAELLALDEVEEDEDESFRAGATYQEKNREDFDTKSPALYTCRLMDKTSLFRDRNVNGPKVTYNRNSVNAEVLYVGSAWTVIRYKEHIGYVKRDRLIDVTPIDKKNTAPYGVQKSTYIATTAETCYVRKSMSDEDDSWVVLNPGTKLSVWRIQDGWAIVPYWRTYGYIDMNQLTDLIPVSPTDEPLSEESPIAAYTSYYTMAQTKINAGRIINISVACKRLTRVMKPGESFNFNKDVGPYKKSIGYQPAWVLVDGKSVPGYGGGTCQVSSTLYNALLQLPGIGILQRRPHGPAGAKYLPHGVDAAVGNSNLNLRFENNYPFSIRVEGHSSGDGALLMLVYKVNK